MLIIQEISPGTLWNTILLNNKRRLLILKLDNPDILAYQRGMAVLGFHRELGRPKNMNKDKTISIKIDTVLKLDKAYNYAGQEFDMLVIEPDHYNDMSNDAFSYMRTVLRCIEPKDNLMDKYLLNRNGSYENQCPEWLYEFDKEEINKMLGSSDIKDPKVLPAIRYILEWMQETGGSFVRLCDLAKVLQIQVDNHTYKATCEFFESYIGRSKADV